MGLLKASIAMLALAAMAIHASYIQPYISSHHNRMEAFVMCMSILTLWGGTVTYSSALSKTAIIIGLSLSLLAIVLGVIYDFYRLKKKEERALSSMEFEEGKNSLDLRQDEDDAAVGTLMETYEGTQGPSEVSYNNPVFDSAGESFASTGPRDHDSFTTLDSYDTAALASPHPQSFDSPPPPPPKVMGSGDGIDSLVGPQPGLQTMPRDTTFDSLA